MSKTKNASKTNKAFCSSGCEQQISQSLSAKPKGNEQGEEEILSGTSELLGIHDTLQSLVTRTKMKHTKRFLSGSKELNLVTMILSSRMQKTGGHNEA